MVESTSRDTFSQLDELNRIHRGLVQVVLLPFLDARSLSNYAQLNKASAELFRPGTPHCVNFLNLFEAQGIHLEDSDKDELPAQKSLVKVLDFVASTLTEPKLLKKQKYGFTYRRRNPQSQRKELLAYGGGNESMWSETERFFERLELPDSVFKMPVLHLKGVFWMNPWCILEGIPAEASKISVYIYHAYGEDFGMNNTLLIKLAVQDEIEEPVQDAEQFETVHESKWPMPNANTKIRGALQREKLLDLPIDRSGKMKGQVLALRLSVDAASGDWKSDWFFEGIAVEVIEG